MIAGSNRSPTPWLRQINPAAFPLSAALPSNIEVVIIGGGIMGISTAYWLARFGLQVLLLEAYRLAWGASGRNAGLMLAGSRPLEDPQLVQTVLQEENIAADYIKPGHLALASSEAIWDKILQEAALRQKTTVPVYALDHAACEDLLGLQVNKRFLGGRWLPQGGLIHPTRFVYGLATAALRHGASLVTETRVLRVKPAPGRDCFNLYTNRGKLRARQVVFACHVGLGEFIPDFRKIITPMRGQVMSTQPLPKLFNVGLAVDWGTVYWRQAPDGAIVLGGYRNHDPLAEASGQEWVNPHIQEALAHFLPEAFPGFPAFHVNQRWAGIMDHPLDGQPVIGARPQIPNQWLIAGFGGHGLPVGLGAGKALAEAIITGQIPAVLEPFDPGRFANQGL